MAEGRDLFYDIAHGVLLRLSHLRFDADIRVAAAAHQALSSILATNAGREICERLDPQDQIMLGVSDCWSGGVHSGEEGVGFVDSLLEPATDLHVQVVEPFFFF